MTVNGTDWSHWNNSPNPDPFDFIIHKATQGDHYVDPRYGERKQWIRDLGKIWGAYLFPEVATPPERQVDHFREIADIRPGDIVALDFESDGTWSHYTNAHLAAFGDELMALLQYHYPDNRVLLYCNRSAYSSIALPYQVSLGDGLWIASPGSIPTMSWVIWQYGNGAVDYDRADFPNIDTMWQWATKRPAPQPGDQQFLLTNG